jgi:dihydrofolate synthase/folylpolyglutamate synthase
VVAPAASVIVSIGLDHQAILGDTIEKIAYEKAGIIKPGIPLILGSVPEPAARVIREVAAEQHSPVWAFGHEITWDAARKAVTTPEASFEGLEPSLQGLWQSHNLSLAVGALAAARFQLTSSAAKAGAANAYAPGRYEKKRWKGRTVILDGAHNADSAAALLSTLKSDLGPTARVVLLTNMLLGHDPGAFYAPFAGIADSAVIAPVEFHRRRDPAETVSVLKGLGVPAEAVGSVDEALARCLDLPGPEIPILVTGSFYLVGEVVRAMSGSE